MPPINMDGICEASNQFMTSEDAPLALRINRE